MPRMHERISSSTKKLDLCHLGPTIKIAKKAHRVERDNPLLDLSAQKDKIMFMHQMTFGT